MVTSWACLPDLVFNLILLKLPFLPDQVRFASVCTRWRWAAKHEGAKLFTDPLFLIPTVNGADSNLFEEKTLLYSVGENRTYSINLPFSRYGPVIRFCGASHGWLIMLHKDFTITLYKPTPKPTKQATNTIRLPPIVVDLDPIDLKVTLSADPTTSDHYTAVAIYGAIYCPKPNYYSAIWTSGNENWTLHKDMGVQLYRATWYKNKLYAVTNCHKVVHIDGVSSENPRAITVCKLAWQAYLAESSRGEFLMIRKFPNSSTIRFKVYKLEANECALYNEVDKVEAEEAGREGGLYNKVVEAEEGGGEGGLYSAVEVEEVGGDALFLGHNSAAVAVGALGTRHKDCIYDLSDPADTLNVFCLDSGRGETHNYHHAPLMLSARASWITFWVTPLLADDWI